MTTFDAVVLAGGRGSRLGGVSKADLVVGGQRLLDRVLAATEGAHRVVVVGDVVVPEGVLLTREDPPGTGPAAGLVAGLDVIDAPAQWTLVLACDLPDAGAGVASLLAALAGSETETPVEAYCLRRRDGGPEWLLGLYHSTALRQAAAAYGDPRDRSVRGMLGSMAVRVVEPPVQHHSSDLDTWADHARWSAELRRRREAGVRPAEDRTRWRPFIERACAALGVDPALVDEDAILGMTREVAHAGARPMAPVAAYVLGLAVGQALHAGTQPDPDYLRRVLEDASTAAPIPAPQSPPRNERN